MQRRLALFVLAFVLTLIPSVSAIVYQNIQVETEGFEICFNNATDCSNEFNRTSKEDGIIYIRNAEYDLRVEPVTKFVDLVQNIIFPMIVALLLMGVIYAVFTFTRDGIFG